MSTIFFENPLDAAKLWISQGAKTLHIVDLDGAFKGESCNLEIISNIKKETGCYVQMGGGIRDKDTIETVFKKGIDRVILGTAALKDRDLVEWAVENYGDRIAISIDALNDKVAYHGWTGISEITVWNLFEALVGLGAKTFVYTDISKDGMMAGPNIDSIKEINEGFKINMIASGGVTTIDDVKRLKEIGVYGAIIGKALYSGNIKVQEALEVSECS